MSTGPPAEPHKRRGLVRVSRFDTAIREPIGAV
jgi:hypothetical protein